MIEVTSVEVSDGVCFSSMNLRPVPWSDSLFSHLNHRIACCRDETVPHKAFLRERPRSRDGRAAGVPEGRPILSRRGWRTIRKLC